MRVYSGEISDQRMIKTILLCLLERFNHIVAEQTKDVFEMSIREFMSSLKSYEERLLRQSEKPIESAFQLNMNLNGKSFGEFNKIVVETLVVEETEEDTTMEDEEIFMENTITS